MVRFHNFTSLLLVPASENFQVIDWAFSSAEAGLK